REDQDQLAATSQARAAHAIAEGRFTSQILPVQIKVRGKPVEFAVDEHGRETTVEDLAKLRPIFRAENGTVTAGNASGINDGAAAVVLADEATVKAQGLKPMARLVAYAHQGVDPAYMGIG